AFLSFSRPEQRQSVIEALASGIRSDVESLLKLRDGLGLGSRILVECLAEITVTPQALFQRTVRRSSEQDKTEEDERALHGPVGLTLILTRVRRFACLPANRGRRGVL